MDRLINRTPFGAARTPWATLFSYIFDYAIIVILAIAYAALDKLVTPFNQRFSLRDITIQYTFAVKERIPIAEALVISFAFPLGVIAVYTLIIDGLFSHHKQPGRKVWTFKDRAWELNCGILGLLLAQGAAFCITGTLKNLVGRPRPDLIDRCQPPAGAQDALVFGLSVSSICTQTDKAIMQDGFRSFPSGHSSSSFAGLFYLSLYLSGKLHVMDQRGEVWRTVIVIVPTMAAACVAVSRIMDYRHHPFDVMFGSVLGIVCGWAAYRQYFPPLSHSWLKGRAYPMRQWGVTLRTAPNAQNAEYRGQRQRPLADAVPINEDLQYNPGYPLRQPTDQSYSLEPMRPRVPSRPIDPDSEDATPPPTTIDTIDYERVRPKTAVSQTPTVTITRAPRSGSNNAFREQIEANDNRRGGPLGSARDEEANIGQPPIGVAMSNPI